MKRVIFVTLVASLLQASAGTAHAQIKVVKAPAPAVGPDEYVVYTWTSSWGLRDDAPDQYPLGIATHKTLEDATAAAKAHMARTKDNGAWAVTHYLIEGEASVRSRKSDKAAGSASTDKTAPSTAWVDRLAKSTEALEMAHEAKAAFDKALKDFAKNGLKAAERKVGDTLKEYENRIKKAYKEIDEVKTNMTSMTGSLTKKQFDEVNKLINTYNSYQGSLAQTKGLPVGMKLASAPTISRVQPSDLKAKILPGTTAKLDPPKTKQSASAKSEVRVEKAVNVAGSTFAGSETLGGYGKLRFSFAANGTATMYDTDGATKGSWSKNGNQVTLRFYDGSVTYQGTLSGSTLSGTATNGRTTWNWTMKVE